MAKVMSASCYTQAANIYLSEPTQLLRHLRTDSYNICKKCLKISSLLICTDLESINQHDTQGQFKLGHSQIKIPKQAM